MTGKIIKAELRMQENKSYTELAFGMEPSAVEKALFPDASVTATLVFVHCLPCLLPQKTQNPLDPLDSHRSITNDNGLTLDTKDLLTQENHSPRSNSGSSSSNDAKKVIPPRAVSDKRRLFELDKSYNDSKPQPIRWSTHDSVLKTQSVQKTGNISYTTKHEQAIALSTPPQSPPQPSPPPPSPLSTPYSSPPPSTPMTSQPVKAKLDVPPSNNPTTGNVESTERDQTPESNPSPGTPDPKHVGEDGTQETTKTPAKKRAALVCRSSPNQRKTLGSPPGEVGTDHVSSQMILAKDEPSPNATPSFNSSSYHNNSTSTPAQHKQNPWNLFGSPDAVKIYSALTCGLACGALAAISVPAAPVVAGIAGIAAGGVVGYAIAEKISRDMEKKRNENNATRL